MDDSSTIKSPQWFDPEALFEFIEELRLANYNIGINHYLLVQDLILTLAAKGEPLEHPQRLQTLLGPILCSSPSEQSDFEHRFERWVRRMGYELDSSRFSLSAEALAEELENLEDRASQWELWKNTVLILLAVLLVLFLFLRLYVIIPREVWLIFLSPLTIIVARWIWWQYQALLFLKRRNTTEEPEVQGFSVPQISEELFPNVLLFRLSQSLRRHVKIPTQELDVDATVKATTAQAGLFSPIFRIRQVRPEYLILIDRASFGDHQARLVEILVHQLAENDVYLTRYFFDGDPRLCYPTLGGERPYALRNLVARYPDHRLVIFADAAIFFSHRHGGLVQWAEELLSWSKRFLLTPKPTSQWGFHEIEVSRHFVVLTATTGGLASLGNNLYQTEQISATGESKDNPLPTILQIQPRRWISREKPSEKDVNAMLVEVRRYLDPAGYHWLCACAVYPELIWDLTIYLGHSLQTLDGIRFLEVGRLASLSRLPWFRHTYLPDWLRTRLIEDMPKLLENQVRARLETMLVMAMRDSKGSFQLEFAQEYMGVISSLARPLLRLLLRRAADDSVLKDRIFVSFMINWNRKPLFVRVPEALNVRLRHGSIGNKATDYAANFEESYSLSSYDRLVKRIFDLLLILLGLPLLLLVISLISLLIKLDSPGPVFFRQVRVGENGRVFEMLKFRTLVVDPERKETEIDVLNNEADIIYKYRSDPRITELGHFLRSTSLDELPQLLNVIRGDMSLVGPRPELPRLLMRYEPWQLKRLEVPQGITGWWLVNERSNHLIHLHTEDDLYYIQNYSLWMDIYIILKTPLVILRGRSAY